MQEINLKKWDKNQKNEEDYKITACPYCNHDLQHPYWEPHYNGIRAKCNKCKVTWNLS